MDRFHEVINLSNAENSEVILRTWWRHLQDRSGFFETPNWAIVRSALNQVFFSTAGDRNVEGLLNSLMLILYAIAMIAFAYGIKRAIRKVFSGIKAKQNADDGENKYYAQAFEEADTGKVNKGLWAKCYANQNGHEEHTKSEYIKLRVKNLMESNKRQEATERQTQRFKIYELPDGTFETRGRTFQKQSTAVDLILFEDGEAVRDQIRIVSASGGTKSPPEKRPERDTSEVIRRKPTTKAKDHGDTGRRGRYFYLVGGLLFWSVIIGAAGQYFYDKHQVKQARREAREQKEQLLRERIADLANGNNAVTNWTEELIGSEKFRRSPVATAELQAVWIGPRPILFFGLMEDIVLLYDDTYELELSDGGFLRSFIGVTPSFLSFRPRVGLRLVCNSEFVNALLHGIPNVRDFELGKQPVAMIADIRSIKREQRLGVDGAPETVLIGVGRCVDALHIGL